ncbi:hypothetical protein [Desulfofalx alkaliphila]|uniref:hypothetical protein n=1 Tax=Desulfofalx alkaliphila TaxID=105483 RepID=UPI0004E1FDD4|nr:hypothetical protein [Desulfofalx alkaliphila]
MLNYKRLKFWAFVFLIVFVTVIGIGLMSNPKTVGIIGDADETTVSPQNGVVIAESDRVTLYATNVKEDMYEGITVLTKDKSKTFSWVNVMNPTYTPTITITDKDNDGKDEVIIILTTGIWYWPFTAGNPYFKYGGLK